VSGEKEGREKREKGIQHPESRREKNRTRIVRIQRIGTDKEEMAKK